MNDDDLLAIVKSEHDRAVGLDNDSELTEAREKALNYAQGLMPDVPSLKNRSKAVSTDVADAVETVLPDLMEMFTGGEDVASFEPRGPEDEEAARQETDFLYHTVFNLNDGFGALYAGIKDALLVKTGVFTFWWDEDEVAEEEFEGSVVDYASAAQAAMQGQFEIIEAQPDNEDEPQSVKWRIRRIEKYGCARFKAVPPEDFAVSRDTVALRDATYCVMRSRPRAQDLIADGYDAAQVEKLPAYVQLGADAVSQARDTASESEQGADGSQDLLRTVEILHHCVKVVENGKAQFYSLVTDNDCSVLLDKDKLERVCFAAITPYPVAHRFYGESLADKLIQIQQIKTALVRMLLDSGYFAMNQRVEVSENDASANTISDLLRNEPGVPVRSKSGQAVRALTAGQLGFDVMGALEYVAVASEQRTGIVRNAQGLNPDTLHDTAKGAQALMTQAQKRVRMIARIFAETGLKDLFLGLHQLIRKHGTKGQKARLRGKWVEIDPTSWGSRDDMTIEIGVGAGGREQELAALQGVQGMIAGLIQIPQGQGMVTPENLYNLAKKTIERSGLKSAEAYITDPASVQPQQPPPDPKMLELQQEGEIARAKLQQDAQLKREQMLAEMQLKREQMALEAQLKAQQAAMNASMAQQSLGQQVRFGGDVG